MNKFIFKTCGVDINVYVQDNKAKKTLFFIHGFNSSHEFAAPIYKMVNNFNIIAIDFPTQNASFDLYVNIVKDILDKIVKGQAILVGHSLGAAVALFLKDHPKVEGRILVSPLNPTVTRSKRYAFFTKLMMPETRFQRISASIAQVAASKIAKHTGKSDMHEFLTNNPEINTFMLDQVFTENFSNELDKLYRQYDAKYIIGSYDEVISPTLLEQYLHSFSKNLIFIEKALHNPFKANPTKLHSILNDEILFKKRFFLLGKFYSKKFINKENN